MEGSHETAPLVLLLVPLCLVDARRWHWWSSPADDTGDGADPSARVQVGQVALRLVQLQIAWIYVDAAVAKLSVAEWANGTAMYDIVRNPFLEGWPPVRELFLRLTLLPLGAILLTWAPIALEVAIAACFFRQAARWRWHVLPFALLFHLFIAPSFGIESFALVMSAALVIHLVPDVEFVPAAARAIRRVVARRTVPVTAAATATAP